MAEESIQQVRQILAAQIELAKLHIENWLVFFAFLRGKEKSKSSAAERQYSRSRAKSSARR